KKHSDMIDINARFKEKILSPEENMNRSSDNAISYFELYEKISLINRQLIEQRERLEEEKSKKKSKA
ncbi:MAG: hypothetical protein IJ630_07275, partial [Treponema sp.]|nr:hypothetical protein [Treponema sp.]